MIKKLLKYGKNYHIESIEAVRIDDVVIITRLELLKYILTIDKTKKNEGIDKNIDSIKEKYPLVLELENIFNDFHKLMFGKNLNELDIFIEKYNSKISSLNKIVEQILENT